MQPVRKEAKLALMFPQSSDVMCSEGRLSHIICHERTSMTKAIKY